MCVNMGKKKSDVIELDMFVESIKVEIKNRK